MPEETIVRYLVPFHPKRVPHYFTDILIIGAGLAGLRAAIAVDRSLSVLVVSKKGLDHSSSFNAQGGIAGVLSPEDDFQQHIDDTLSAGGSLCDPETVEMVIREAPERIAELIKWGTRFDRRGERLLLGREGGHGRNRVAHALGDATGKEIMRAVGTYVQSLPNVQLWKDTFTIDLLTWQGRCRGALLWNESHGRTIVWAKQTILCTGGVGQIYRESTNPPIATGDGHALAYRAGAELRDMEFVQFHPTVLYIAGSSRTLITEAVRGEGAYLVDCNGHRFMPDYDPRGELAPRDVVAKVIVKQMAQTQHPNVYLDLSHLSADFVLNRFPSIAAGCAEFGIDITKDKIPVRPGAHYMIGGVTIDQFGRTTLPGLWAAGEVTSTGLHGGNRLASNSLLEAIVYGTHAGREASSESQQMDDDFCIPPLASPPAVNPTEPLDVNDIRNSLKSLMWRAAAVQRSGEQLKAALETINNWCNYVLVRRFTNPKGWELQNMLIVARVIVQAALARRESRGVHFRTDYPDLDEAHWRHRRLTYRLPENGD